MFPGRTHGTSSRRTFLQVGMLGATGLTLTDYLRLQAAAERPEKDRAVIFVWLDGGPSHLELFDPKPDAPGDYRGPFAAIPTKVAGVRVSEVLPRLANLADRFALVRSCGHNNTDHGGSRGLCNWGHNTFAGSPELKARYPSIGSITAKVRGPNRRAVPAYVTLPQPVLYNQGGAAYLGPAYDPFVPNGPGMANLRRHARVSVQQFEDRRALVAEFDGMRRAVDDSGVLDGMDALSQQAFEIVSGQAASDAFRGPRNATADVERYGRQGGAYLTARRLVEAGVTFVTVNSLAWDDHADIAAKMRQRGLQFDQGIAGLVEDIYSRGLDKKVMLVVWGEFGRTPKVNKDGGRDHWPQAASVLLAGGGLKVGQVVGATDRRGAFATERPLSPQDVLATLYHHLGIDTEQQFLNQQGRPISILPHGKPIDELL